MVILVLEKEAKNSLNIVRYATSKLVVGSLTKLLKYTELTFMSDRFVAIWDHCVSEAHSMFKEAEKMEPDSHRKAKHKGKPEYTEQRFKEDSNLHWQDGLTEQELAELNNIYCIWDAGKIRWVKHVP